MDFIGYQVQLLHIADEENEAPKRLSNLQQTHQEFLLVYNGLLTVSTNSFCNYLH